MPAIDIGADAIDRPVTWSGNFTIIALDNPANDTGTIDTFEVWANENISDFRAGTFFLVSGTTYECRDSTTIGSVTSGSKQTFSGLSVDVETSDYAGCYFTGGKLERDSAGFAGLRYKSGEYIDSGDQASYSLGADDAFSLYGTGETGGGNPAGTAHWQKKLLI